MKVIIDGKTVFQQKIKTQSNWILNSSTLLKYLAIGTLPIVIVVSLVH